MLPERVKAAAEKAEEMTKNNDRFVRTPLHDLSTDSCSQGNLQPLHAIYLPGRDCHSSAIHDP